MHGKSVQVFYVTLWWMSFWFHLIISQENNAASKFQLTKDVRYECRVLYTVSSHDKLECATECAAEDLCSAFKLHGSQCVLLSAEAPCRTSASGWTHWSRTGKYQQSHHQHRTPVSVTCFTVYHDSCHQPAGQSLGVDDDLK